MLKRGLLLMVGATGSGKSTTLAAMINYRNENSSDHIITIEDPIEFLHPNKKSIVNQREVGLDTKSYARALRSAMRAAPDVHPDRRDPRPRDHGGGDHARRHGHLVLATLHANNAAETLDRIINMFPRDQHTQIFLDLSQYLRAIISQRLVRGQEQARRSGRGACSTRRTSQELIKKGDVIGVEGSAAHVEREGHAELRHGAVRALSRRAHHAGRRAGVRGLADEPRSEDQLRLESASSRETLQAA